MTKRYRPVIEEDEAENEDIYCGYCRCELELHVEGLELSCNHCFKLAVDSVCQEWSERHWHGKWIDLSRKATQIGISFSDLSNYRFTWADSDKLELIFPGCTASWEMNSLLKEWSNFYLRIYINYRDDKGMYLEAFKTDLDGMLIRVAGEYPKIEGLPGKDDKWVRPLKAHYSSEMERWIIIR